MPHLHLHLRLRLTTLLLPHVTTLPLPRLLPTMTTATTTTSVATLASAHSDFLTAQLASLPHLPPSAPLSPRVHRILGGNPGHFHLQGTNTYLLGTGRRRLLIDTALGLPIWKATLSTYVASANIEIATCLLTHWHHDHVSGVADLKELQPAAEVRKHRPEYKTPAWFTTNGKELREIEDGQEFTVEGATVRAVKTPGHTQDHMCFYLLEEGALFTGDTVLGHGTTVFEDLASYMASLQVLAREIECAEKRTVVADGESEASSAGASGAGSTNVAVEGARKRRLYPAHGDVIPDGSRKLREYINHRERRERQVLSFLQKEMETRMGGVYGGHGGGMYGGFEAPEKEKEEEVAEGRQWALSSMGLVERIYRGVDRSMHKAAEQSTLQVLEKLVKEGRVGVVEEEGADPKKWFLRQQ